MPAKYGHVAVIAFFTSASLVLTGCSQAPKVETSAFCESYGEKWFDYLENEVEVIVQPGSFLPGPVMGALRRGIREKNLNNGEDVNTWDQKRVANVAAEALAECVKPETVEWLKSW